MPLPPPPRTFICTRCTWQRTTLPKSDALVLGRDWFSRCPLCADDSLESRIATRTKALKARLGQFLRSGG